MSDLRGYDVWKQAEPDANDPGRVDGNRYPDPCDWCQCLVYPDQQIHAHHGGRFCSDECVALYSGDMPVLEHDDPIVRCDTCGSVLLGGEGGAGTTIQGVGSFCHRNRKPACSAAGVEQHRRRMESRIPQGRDPRVLQGRW